MAHFAPPMQQMYDPTMIGAQAYLPAAMQQQQMAMQMQQQQHAAAAATQPQRFLCGASAALQPVLNACTRILVQFVVSKCHKHFLIV